MKALLIIALGILISFGFQPGLAETKTVEVKVSGRFYNDVWKRWSEEVVRVYVDDEANVYIAGGDKLIGAKGFISSSQLVEAIGALKKGREWAEKAAEAKLEATKEIASFWSEYDNHQQGISFVFFSAKEGTQTDVILRIKDFDNMFKNIDLYLDPDQVKQLITAFEDAPKTYKILKENTTKAADILK